MPAKVDTATLIRGDLYALRHPKSTPERPLDTLRFEYNKPVVIDDKDVLRELEELYDETTDGDGEIFEKPVFRVDRGVPAPEGHNGTKRTRLAATRATKKRPVRRK